MSAPNVYARFIEEVDVMVVAAADPAVKVVGDLTRAVKRAQMVHDGELDPVAQRVLGRPASEDHTPPAPTVTLEQARERLTAQMVDPTACPYCHGTGWVFLDKSYNGYALHGGPPYVEPDDLNGGYEACGRCNDDHEVPFGTGETVKPWRRWTDDQVDEIVAALAASPR